MKRTALQIFVLSIPFNFFGQLPAAAPRHLYYERYASARQVLHEYIRQQPADPEAWHLLIKSYMLQDNFEKAEDTFALAPPSIEKEPLWLVTKGSILLAGGKSDSSRRYFEKAIDITKGRNSGILAAIAECEINTQNGDLSYATGLLRQAIKRDKNNASLFVLLGNAYRKVHNGGEAFQAYKKAIEKDEHLAAAYYQLGDLFEGQKNEELYMEYFIKAIEADDAYGPAYFSIYNHYIYDRPDPEKAMQYFKKYAAVSDQTLQQDYSRTDLLYLTKDYRSAIAQAKSLVAREGDRVRPRIYKLAAYSFAELGDTTNAIDYMTRYFSKENDSNLIAKDFETMAGLYSNREHGADMAAGFLMRAAAVTNDSAALYNYYKDLAASAGKANDYETQAKWLGMFYTGNNKAGNVDLFNWGIAAFRAGNYLKADSVFALYTDRYPAQGFGYYWRARSNAVMDSAMAQGLAIPHYNKLLEVTNMDSLTDTGRKWVLEAYSYLAAYETNTEKNYKKAIDYFSRVLEIDPANSTAKKYIPILEANVNKEVGSN